MVEGIIKVRTGVDLTPFMDTANHLVTQCCTELAADYTAGQLELIERWLAAHCYAQKEKQIEAEKADVVSRKFATKVELGFDNTYHGQTAMRLDFYGGLARLNDEIKKGLQKTVSVNWLGTNEEDAEDPE